MSRSERHPWGAAIRETVATLAHLAHMAHLAHLARLARLAHLAHLARLAHLAPSLRLLSEGGACDAGRVAGGTPCWCGGTLHHSQVTAKSPLSHLRQRGPYLEPGRNKVTAVGFEPTPLRNGALSHRLRPLGQTVLVLTHFKLRTQ